MNTTQKNNSKCTTRRPQFNPCQFLTSDQLNQQQTFHLESLRRVVHGLAGSGVVYGFSISTDDGTLIINKGCIEISCGLAFDDHGRQLYWPGGWIGLDHLASEKPDCEGKYTLCMHYAEQHDKNGCGSCESKDGQMQWIDHCVVFSLKKGCKDNDDDCKTWEGCPDINDYVCDYQEQMECHCPEDDLCPTHCDDIYYDARHCVTLACLEICDLTQDTEKCDPVYGFSDCSPLVCDYRQFVYSNHLLGKLANGEHLNYTRVKCLSWQEWILYNNDCDDKVAWEKFVHRFEDRDNDGGFVIHFTKPVRSQTLNRCSVIFSAVTQEARSNYWESRRIPLEKIEKLDEDKDGCVTAIKLIFEKDWYECEIKDNRSTLEYGAIIELTLRGSLIRDKCGCMLDAQPLKTKNWEKGCCQNMPGRDFIAVFRVGPKIKDQEKKDKSSDDDNPSNQNSEQQLDTE